MEQKSNNYFILNPFAKDGSDQEIVKYEENQDETVKVLQNEVDNKIEFKIEEDDNSENIDNIKNLNKVIELSPTIKKYVKDNILTIEVADKKPRYLYLKIGLTAIAFPFIALSIFPAVQILGSVVAGAYMASLFQYRKKKEITVSEKILSVNNIKYPVSSIKKVGLAQRNEIFYESNISIDFMSLHLILDNFSNSKKEVIDDSNRDGDKFRIVFEMNNKPGEDNAKMFVIADNLSKEEGLILFRELVR